MTPLRASLVLLLIAASATAQTVPPDHAAKMAKGLDLFKKTIRPLFEEKCLKCHGGRSVEAEFDLSDRDALLKGGQNGKAIDLEKPATSKLLKLLRHQQEPHMPKDRAKLPDAAIAQIAAWIDLGAPYDSPLVAAKKTKVSWTQKVLPDGAKTFWSFQPLHRVAPPPVKNEAWPKTNLDRFILAAMEKAKLQPNPAASKLQLVRRAYFDLIGLPPTPDEIDAFLNDRSPDVWPRLIDKLLASPHYGERWARHWLDLARFAESHGFEHDYDRPTAYHYRDFVIEALNRDVPYDTFVKWQIAGDEYEPENHLAVKATGFLAAGVHSTQITKSEAEKHRYDELDDKLNTLGTAFLGLTIGCARCHDHKYDPIPARDYYRLLSTFTTTVRTEMDLNVDPEGFRKAKHAFDRKHEPFERAVKQYESEKLAAGFAAWEKLGKHDFAWETADVKEMKTLENATLTKLPDGSILATGTNATWDTYTFVADTTLEKLTAVRIEALTHPSMIKGGPGRAGNGNFALSDFRVSMTPLEQPNAKAVELKLVNPRATHEQKGLPVAAAIDNDNKSAWSIDGQIGKDHAAVFDVAKPVEQSGGMRLTFKLRFSNNGGHQMGRVRLGVADRTPPTDLRSVAISRPIREALASAADKRTSAQRDALLAWYRPLDAGWSKLDAARTKHAMTGPKPPMVRALVASEGLPALRLHTQGDDFYPQTYFLRRGDTENKEGVADQGFLQVLMPSPDAASRWTKPAPTGSRTPWKRHALAEWLTDTEQGAGNLLARVIVNRLWQHHLGHGLVATPSDFGIRGERPTHPELLDYLAAQLIEHRWSLKAIHKLILTSSVYQQSSAVDESRAKIDRDNKLVWHNPSRRLSAEVIRDTLLAVSGELDAKMFGPGTLDETSKRRSIYFTVKRSKLMPMMVIFDAPEALGGMADRPTTTIAPQALHLMNNANMRRYAKSFAARIGEGADAIDRAYRMAVGRPPSAEERSEGLAFLEQQAATYPADGASRALADFCQVLMCLNEFVYVD
jgi:hypothetical protein